MSKLCLFCRREVHIAGATTCEGCGAPLVGRQRSLKELKDRILPLARKNAHRLLQLRQTRETLDGDTGRKHSANIDDDDGGQITFHWHWPRGTFDKHMSAYEIAAFVLPHMPSIAGLFSDHPRIRAEFEAMLVVLATHPRTAIDQIVPWIKPVVRTSDFDILELCMTATNVDKPTLFTSLPT